jgi:hypothetical protein
MARRHHGKRRPSSKGALGLKLGLVAIIGLGLWWSVTLAMATRQKISSYPAKGGHGFISLPVENPTLLVIEQGSQPAQVASIAVLHINNQEHSLSALKLPTDISDGQTTAAEYLESGYYKELQQMVEQCLALPISGYLIQPRQASTSPDQVAWSDLLLRQPKPTWWQTSIGLPWWLGDQPTLKTNLTLWQLANLAWLTRDAADQRVTIQTASADLFQTNANHQLVADTQNLDPLVGHVFADQQAINQGVSVVVKNATDVTGLAGLVARYVQHLGGEIVAVEPADTGQVNSSMKGEKASQLSQSLTSLLGVPLTVTARTGRERADLEIVVGVDTLNRVGKPAQ